MNDLRVIVLLKSYSVKDVASALSMNEETVRRWIRDDKLKAENIGGRVGYRISEDNLKKFILEEKGIKSFTKEMAVEMNSKDSLYNGIFGESNFFNSIAKKNLQISELNNSAKTQNDNCQSEVIRRVQELQEKATWLKNEIAKMEGQLQLIESEITGLEKNDKKKD